MVVRSGGGGVVVLVLVGGAWLRCDVCRTSGQQHQALVDRCTARFYLLARFQNNAQFPHMIHPSRIVNSRFSLHRQD